MLQHLAKWALFAAVWRQVRPYLAGTLVAIVALVLITALHAEYVDYLRLSREVAGQSVESTQASTLLFSFVAKWFAYVVTALSYAVYVGRKALARKVPRGANKAKAKDGSKQVVAAKAVEQTATSAAQSEADDRAFDFLRRKGRLESRADKLLKSDAHD